MSTTKEYIGNLQRRIANQRAEIEHLRSVSERKDAEIYSLRQRLAENENGYEQTLYLERLKYVDTVKVLEKLLYSLRTNMTSVTRYVKRKHGKIFEERQKEYLRLAEFAVDNILKCLNENEAIDNIFRKHFADKTRIEKKIKSEAIKLFAYMLKQRVDCEYGNKFYRDKCFEEIDNLVKEMTGEQK